LEVTHPAIYQYQLESKSNLSRRAFLRYVFHEVRVPLNTISLGVQLLSEVRGQIQQEDLETILVLNEATTHIGETLNDVLVLQKLEEGSLKLVIKPFLIKDLLASCFGNESEVFARAKEKGVELTYKIAANTPEIVEGDKYRIRHVLVTLISNAVKYSNPDGIVTVSVEVDESGLYDYEIISSTFYRQRVDENAFSGSLDDNSAIMVFKVIDEGKGISPDDVPNVFIPFLVTRAGDLQKVRGSGVSLAIAKQIMDMHGGLITCSSVLGKGSVFTVVLPMTVRAEHMSDGLLKATNQTIDNLMPYPAPANPPPSDGGKKILTIDTSDEGSKSSIEGSKSSIETTSTQPLAPAASAPLPIYSPFAHNTNAFFADIEKTPTTPLKALVVDGI